MSRFFTWGDFMKAFRPFPLTEISRIAGYWEGFINVTTSLARASRSQLDVEGLPLQVDESWRQEQKKELGAAKEWCREFGFTLSAISAERLAQRVADPNITAGAYQSGARELAGRVCDEAESLLFFHVEPANAHFALGQALFDESSTVAVSTAFPSTAWDIEEAARCLAFERWTAGVFHLGRVAELATVTICRSIGYASPKEGFGEALKYLDNGLETARKDYRNASETLKGDLPFFQRMSAQMHAVNDAWRTRVAHMDTKYTGEEAKRIWDATKGLMQHLATSLKQEPTA